MPSRDALEKEIISLGKHGDYLVGCFSDIGAETYNGWYTRALHVVQILLPDRLEDFRSLYRPVKGAKHGPDYTLYDYFSEPADSRSCGIAQLSAVLGQFTQQVAILKSAGSRLHSILDKFAAVLKDEVFESELLSARAFVKIKQLRAAGAVAGVVLEKHLSEVCKNHKIKPLGLKPTLNDYSQALKDPVLGLETWKKIEYLSSIRNLCCHAKDREPSKDQVEELISGVEKITLTVF